jgi:hypothetical protein
MPERSISHGVAAYGQANVVSCVGSEGIFSSSPTGSTSDAAVQERRSGISFRKELSPPL